MLPRHVALLALLVLLRLSHPASAAESSDIAADEETLRAAHVAPDGSALLAFFRERTLDEETQAEIEALIGQLGSESFRLREKATAKLRSASLAAATLLRQASRHADLEVRWRARQALSAVERRDAPPEVTAAAVRLLGRRPSAETTEVLLDYVPFAAQEDIADAVSLALISAARRDEESQALLTDALADEQPARRGAAGAALCRAGCRAQLPAVRRLLRDTNPHVRRRVASALLEAREKIAVPVLIDLLAELPREEAEQVESLLFVLAGENAPVGRLDDDTRRRYRAAWAAWWENEGDELDLTGIDLAHRWLGRTVVVAFTTAPQTGCVLELDALGRTRWKIEGLTCPIDAQAIDERRVLVTEYGQGQVTERNHKGEVLRRIAAPDMVLEARRLANGNTFLVTRSQILEVDRDGKEVWKVTPDGSSIAAACLLRGGQTAVCYRSGELTRLDRTGKVLASVRIARRFRTYGTHLHALPNGHVLVPHYYENKVAEYDGDGREVWSASYPRPTSAQRLPNGHTLVAGYFSNVLMELDGKGREVKSQRCEGSLMSALRR
jgi:HEAT repeat protein